MGDYAGTVPPIIEGVPPQYPTRLGVAIPVAINFRLFGVHEWSLLIFPIAMSLATMLLAYFTARRFFSPNAGLIALGLLAVTPIDSQFATWLLSDTPAWFFAAAGMLLLYRGYRTERKGWKIAIGIISAACFGWAWLTRAQAAHLAPFIAALLVIWTARERRNLPMAISFVSAAAVIFVAELIMYRFATGDFFHRFRAFEELYEMHRQWYFTEGGVYGWEPGQYWRGLARRLFRLGPEAILFNANFALLPLFGLIGALYALWWKRREFIFPAIWMLWMMFVYNFGSSSLTSYKPLPWIDAYIMPTLFPAVIMAAGFLAMLIERRGSGEEHARERRFWAAGIIATILIAACFGIYQHWRLGIGSPVERRAALDISPADTVYTDETTMGGLRFFWGFQEDDGARAFTGLEASDLTGGSLVLVNHHQLRRRQDIIGYQPPKWVLDPPEDWEAVKRWDQAVLYRVPLEVDEGGDDASESSPGNM